MLTEKQEYFLKQGGGTGNYFGAKSHVQNSVWARWSRRKHKKTFPGNGSYQLFKPRRMRMVLEGVSVEFDEIDH